MDPRTIDFAKTASIDMMSLNNKVVNLRQVVKRTKVHVISKLCKHITALKKKKGTDEQKAKNLRKAQRFIEEIDSIKKLKEDKVSKYALANTAQFSDISKMSLSSGPRALARLADHSLMKKVVTDFREQHSDWRDLAAYLLIKQTGRRFKTKKQKQKKLARCIENINASETMTKVYIQERFGQEGLIKAEQKFERKRKRPKSAIKPGSRENIDNNDSNRQKTTSAIPEDHRTEDLEKRQQEREKKQISTKDADLLTYKEKTVLEQRKKNRGVHKIKIENVVECKLTGGEKSKCEESGDESEENVQVAVKGNFKKNIIPSERDENSDSENTENSSILDKDTQIVSVSHQSKNVRTDEAKSKQRNECVVKELRIGDSDDESSNNDANTDEGTNSDREDDMIEELGSSSNDDQIEDGEKDNHSGKKLKNKQIPKFLTEASRKPMSDPFFAGSDDGREDDMIHEMQNSDGELSADESGKFQARSMFYNPDSQSIDSSKWSQRGRGRRSGFERRGAPGRFDKGQRGRSFRGDSRGRGQSFFGTGRGRNFRGSDKTWAVQKNYDKHGRHHSDRFRDKNAAELETNQEVHKGSTKPKTSQEKLHPSWEASKKRKAEQSGLTAFVGSRITFDDDD